MNQSTVQLRVGTSGWQYDHWVGELYPSDVPKEQWFKHYTGRFDTVEVNNTFYNLPGAETFDSWEQSAPKGFTYALKFSRYGTHMKKLKDPEDTIGRFVERAEQLGKHLGPVLVQLPPNWRPNPERLSAFLDVAPPRVHWAVEFRHRDWLCDEMYDLLRKHNAALCVHDMLENHPREVTADWIYLRFHGGSEQGNYPHQALSAWGRWIQEQLSAGRSVFAYFNNDAHGHAVRNAADLRRFAGGK